MHGHLAAAAKCPAVKGLTLLISDGSEGRDAAHHFSSLWKEGGIFLLHAKHQASLACRDIP